MSRIVKVEELEQLQLDNEWLESATTTDMVKAYAILSVFGSAIDGLKSAVKDRVVAEMDERQATKLPIGDYTVSVTGKEARQVPNFDAGALRALEPLVDPETFAKVMNYQPKPQWKYLKELLKFGGKVKEIIENAQAGYTPRGTTLKVEKSKLGVLEGNEGPVDDLPLKRGQLASRSDDNWEVEKH